jgi:hypothetical protein
MFFVTVQGYLTKDPEIIDGQYGRSLEINLKAKVMGGQQVVYVSGRVFGKKIEVCEKFMRKGSSVTLAGGVRKLRTFGGGDGGAPAFACDMDVADFSLPPSDRQVATASRQANENFAPDPIDEEIPF